MVTAWTIYVDAKYSKNFEGVYFGTVIIDICIIGAVLLCHLG